MRLSIARAGIGGTALLLAACTAGPTAQARPEDPEFWGDHDTEAEGRVMGFEVLVGARRMSDDAEWEPLEDQIDFGMAFQVPLLGERSPGGLDLADYIDWDFGLHYAYDDSNVAGAMPGDPQRGVDTRTWDASIGLLLTPWSEREHWLRPYVGAGATLMYTEVEYPSGASIASEDETFFTGYARGGVRLRFRPGQYFGLDVRWLAGAGHEVGGIDASPESIGVSFLFGATF